MPSIRAMYHIGILAHSSDGAALCFLEMVRESARLLGAHNHPEITLSVLPMGPVLATYQAGDLAVVNTHLMRTARSRGAGSDPAFAPLTVMVARSTRQPL